MLFCCISIILSVLVSVYSALPVDKFEEPDFASAAIANRIQMARDLDLKEIDQPKTTESNYSNYFECNDGQKLILVLRCGKYIVYE